MSGRSVHLHMLSTGSMTSPTGGFLLGETGRLTYPVPVFVIEHPRGLVVVDTGLHPELATTSRRLRALSESFQVHLPADGSGTVGPALSSAGFDPAEVTEVVFTHLHFDHTGGLLELPNARVIVQSTEWAELGNEQQVVSGAYNPDDVDLGHDRVEIDGDHDLFADESIVCLVTNGHTPGHQSVRVRSESGTYVICGDCCYLRRTLTHEHLPPSRDPRQHLMSVRRLAAERSSGATLLYGHDPEQWAVVEREGLHTGV